MPLLINKRRWVSTIFLITYLTTISDAKAGVLQNTATYTFKNADGVEVSGVTNQLKQELVDPLGRIRGCGGEILPNYTGFSAGLYEASSNDTLNGLVPLTRTGSGTNFTGLMPNLQNVNPFFLTNEEPKGGFNFLLNRSIGQIDVGKRYILVINPPAGSRQYSQRQIRLVFTARDDVAKTVSYTATALDGKAIAQDGDPTFFSTTVPVLDANTTGLTLSAVGLLDRAICVGVAQPIQITKTADKAAAEPGDTVIYRLLVKNLNNVGAKQISITDVLPAGFNFVPNSARAELDGNRIAVNAKSQNSNLTFELNETIPPEGAVNVVYAVKITPDALRGTGENLASVSGHRNDTNAELRDGPSRYRVKVRSGIISDCGTLIGRVFEDKNFDGEQQAGEPGIKNAVVILDDGNRITTDEKGLYSVANVLPGSRTSVLDLSSVPGYKIARNEKFRERNSQSRLVRLEPGGLARMNFAVTPVSQQAGDK